MKKRMTYGLLVLVIALWGAIFYRLFSKETPAPLFPPAAVTDTSIVRDTVANYDLIADYRDPFFEAEGTPLAATEPIETDYIPVETQEPYIEPIPVRYGGLIQNSSSNKQIVILNIEGKDVMFADGETHHNVTFLQNFDSYIQILYHGKIETIYK